jgi:hypothetical protein
MTPIVYEKALCILSYVELINSCNIINCFLACCSFSLQALHQLQECSTMSVFTSYVVAGISDVSNPRLMAVMFVNR